MIELPEGVETWDAELRGESLELVQSDTGQWMQVKDVPLIQAQVLAGVKELEEAARDLFSAANTLPTHPGLNESDLETALQRVSAALATLNPNEEKGQ